MYDSKWMKCFKATKHLALEQVDERENKWEGGAEVNTGQSWIVCTDQRRGADRGGFWLDKTDHSNMSEGHMPPKLKRRKTAQRTTVKMNCENGAFEQVEQAGGWVGCEKQE